MKASDNPYPGIILRESANDGSDFSNPSADYRELFLGEDGQLHTKNSAGTVTGIGGTPADITDLPTAETDDTLLLAPDGAGGVEWVAAPTPGISGITVQDEGSPLSTAGTTLNFVGSGVAATGSGATKTITVSGGAGVSGKLPVNVGSATQTSSSTTLAVTITGASSGNLLIACVSSIGTPNVSSIASTNTTWTLLHRSTAGTSPCSEIWKGVVAGGTSGTTVTITMTGATSDRAAVVSEWNGITGTLDQSAMRAGFSIVAGDWHTTPVILPTNANALVVATAATINGTNRFKGADQMVAFEPQMLGTASLGGYLGAYYAFPGTTPIALSTTGPNSANYSSCIVSVT